MVATLYMSLLVDQSLTDVLHPERAAPHSVGCLVRVLLVSRSQCQLVDEVDGHGSLPYLHLLRLPVVTVLLTNLVHLTFELPSHLVFGPVLLSLAQRNLGLKTATYRYTWEIFS